MTKRYIAQCRDVVNYDPIESGSPHGVWSQLEKATGRDRQWLKDFGWRVKLSPIEPKPQEPWLLTAEMLEDRRVKSITEKRPFNWLFWFVLLFTLVSVGLLILRSK